MADENQLTDTQLLKMFATIGIVTREQPAIVLSFIDALAAAFRQLGSSVSVWAKILLARVVLDASDVAALSEWYKSGGRRGSKRSFYHLPCYPTERLLLRPLLRAGLKWIGHINFGLPPGGEKAGSSGLP